MKKSDIFSKLKRIVGADWVRADDLTKFHFGSDVITHFGQGALYPENHPIVVVMPENAKQIQSVLNMAKDNKIPLYAMVAEQCC